ncbi:hypothetical protein [Allorhizocola rhizosphaerae]|uniref:hypothetical protein n=1 Tax=Allorhizocola rhizosphaerae TaxID=1872709 RepID=UPI0013C33580|nr:hypothetical protein [Allorhizocola rhizosphaerae]
MRRIPASLLTVVMVVAGVLTVPTAALAAGGDPVCQETRAAQYRAIPANATTQARLRACPAVHNPALNNAVPAIALLYCEGYFTVTYDPPLTNTPTQTTVTYHNDLDYCLAGGVTRGDASGIFTGVRSCTALDLPPHPATNTYRWNTGASSTIGFSHSTVDRLGNGTTLVASYGTVTHGLNQGANAIHTAIQPQLDPIACAGAGVAHLTGPEKLVFIN